LSRNIRAAVKRVRSLKEGFDDDVSGLKRQVVVIGEWWCQWVSEPTRQQIAFRVRGLDRD
jgi:hypothetical protein